MPRDYSAYLKDIHQAIEHIESFVEGYQKSTFLEDVRTQHACIRNLEVIGEAVKKIPPEIRAIHPQIPWRKIAGLRDFLIHVYFHTDLDIVWEVIELHLPPLKSAIRNLLNP